MAYPCRKQAEYVRLAEKRPLHNRSHAPKIARFEAASPTGDQDLLRSEAAKGPKPRSLPTRSLILRTPLEQLLLPLAKRPAEISVPVLLVLTIPADVRSRKSRRALPRRKRTASARRPSGEPFPAH